MNVPIYVNEAGHECTRCEYYSKLDNPNSFQTQMYLGHMMRRSHRIDPIVIIVANEKESN